MNQKFEGPDEFSKYFSDPEPEVLTQLSRETHLKCINPRMLSDHLQGRFLAMISRLKKPESILEIGTFTGYSAICLAEGLSEKGKLVTIEINPEREDIIRTYFELCGVSNKCELLITDALHFLKNNQDNWDMVFLDADKENYPEYFLLLQSRIKKGGLLIADNVFWNGKVLNPNPVDKETRGILQFLQLIAQNQEFSKVVLPIRDGLLLAEKLT